MPVHNFEHVLHKTAYPQPNAIAARTPVFRGLEGPF
jgi:hypothetical protein